MHSAILGKLGFGPKIGGKMGQKCNKNQKFWIFFGLALHPWKSSSLWNLSSPPLKKILVTPMNTYITIQTKNIAYTSFSIGLWSKSDTSISILKIVFIILLQCQGDLTPVFSSYGDQSNSKCSNILLPRIQGEQFNWLWSGTEGRNRPIHKGNGWDQLHPQMFLTW